MNDRVRLGISPCPNDTYAFHALLERRVEPEGLELEIELADVQELNRRLAAGELDAAKGSFFAALRRSADLVVLPCGAAIGFGVGPLLLESPVPSSRASGTVLCPGEGTTATLLYRLFHAGEGQVRQVVFTSILPALQCGEAWRGVCIHEGRFTFRGYGLELVEDLGTTWERRTGAPLPLGGILARASLGRDCLARLSAAVRASLAFADAHPEEALATMRRHAAEQSDDVLWSHVRTYVGEETRAITALGRRALAEIHARALAAGLLAPGTPPLEVLGN